MTTLKQLYENPVFAAAMKQLLPEQRSQTEKEVERLLVMFDENVIKPLISSGIVTEPEVGNKP